MPSTHTLKHFTALINYNEASEVVYGFNFAVLAAIKYGFMFPLIQLNV